MTMQQVPQVGRFDNILSHGGANIACQRLTETAKDKMTIWCHVLANDRTSITDNLQYYSGGHLRVGG